DAEADRAPEDAAGRVGEQLEQSHGVDRALLDSLGWTLLGGQQVDVGGREARRSEERGGYVGGEGGREGPVGLAEALWAPRESFAHAPHRSFPAPAPPH